MGADARAELATEADPRPSISHDFHCTHDPCRCASPEPFARLRKFLRVWFGLAVAVSAVYGTGRGLYELDQRRPFAAVVVLLLAWITASAACVALAKEDDL